MAIGTKSLSDTPIKNTGKTKREKVQNLRVKHEPLFVKEGAVNAKFIPRMAYKHNGELIIGFYDKEVYGGEDVYTEFCSRDYNPEDPERRLWKWKYNPEYKTEYELSEPHPGTKDRRFLIPIDELINVTELYNPKVETTPAPTVEVEADKPQIQPKEEESSKISTKSLLDEVSSAGEDVPYSAMSLRDHAAIMWQKPVSKRKWLNELITNTFNK